MILCLNYSMLYTFKRLFKVHRICDFSAIVHVHPQTTRLLTVFIKAPSPGYALQFLCAVQMSNLWTFGQDHGIPLKVKQLVLNQFKVQAIRTVQFYSLSIISWELYKD